MYHRDGTAAAHERSLDQLLAERESALLAQIAGITEQVPDVGGIGFGKRVGDGTLQAVQRLSDVGAVDGLSAMLAAVQRARAKLAEGTYGACDICGEQIPEARLEARPWATRCVRHA